MPTVLAVAIRSIDRHEFSLLLRLESSDEPLVTPGRIEPTKTDREIVNCGALAHCHEISLPVICDRGMDMIRSRSGERSQTTAILTRERRPGRDSAKQSDIEIDNCNADAQSLTTAHHERNYLRPISSPSSANRLQCVRPFKSLTTILGPFADI
jgi:hypothetical protein